MNAAFTSAYNDLTNPPVADPPFITFDAKTQLFRIWYGPAYFPTAGNPLNVFFNAELWTLFNSFKHTLSNNSATFDPDGKDVQLTLANLNEMNKAVADIAADPLTYLYYSEQEYITTYNWNPFKRIIIRTASMPIQSEYVRGTGSDTSQIITDFLPPSNSTDLRSVYQYIPFGQYRLIDLTSDEALKDISIRVYWEDIFGNQNPLYLPYKSQMTIKLGFFRKSLFDNTFQDIHEKGDEPFTVPLTNRRGRIVRRK